MQKGLIPYKPIKCNVWDDLLYQEGSSCFSSRTKFICIAVGKNHLHCYQFSASELLPSQRCKIAQIIKSTKRAQPHRIRSFPKELPALCWKDTQESLLSISKSWTIFPDLPLEIYFSSLPSSHLLSLHSFFPSFLLRYLLIILLFWINTDQ